MRGVEADDPGRIKTPEELIRYIDTVGFLPLFKNEIPGFSVEEHTLAENWWSDDAEAEDPWRWREVLAGSGKVAYGKFFHNKAGFISLEWLPYFVNFRRQGYDFDSLWEEGKARYRSKRIMDLLLDGETLFSYEIKQKAGFGKDGEKNFDGTLTELQMQTYLVVREFCSRVNQQGQPYGWHIARYAMPESIWGYDAVTAAYREKPEVSYQRIVQRIREVYPQAQESQIKKVLKR